MSISWADDTWNDTYLVLDTSLVFTNSFNRPAKMTVVSPYTSLCEQMYSHDFLVLGQELCRHGRIREPDPVRQGDNQRHPARKEEEDAPGLEGVVESDLQHGVGEKARDDLRTIGSDKLVY